MSRRPPMIETASSARLELTSITDNLLPESPVAARRRIAGEKVGGLKKRGGGLDLAANYLAHGGGSDDKPVSRQSSTTTDHGLGSKLGSPLNPKMNLNDKPEKLFSFTKRAGVSGGGGLSAADFKKRVTKVSGEDGKRSLQSVTFSLYKRPPIEINWNQLLVSALEAAPSLTNVKAMFEWPVSKSVGIGTFWYTFCSHFQKDDFKEQEALLEKISKDYVKLFRKVSNTHNVAPERSEKFLHAFPYVCAWAVFEAFYVTFQKDRVLFSPLFRALVFREVLTLLTGIELSPQTVDINVGKLFPGADPVFAQTAAVVARQDQVGALLDAYADRTADTDRSHATTTSMTSVSEVGGPSRAEQRKDAKMGRLKDLFEYIHDKTEDITRTYSRAQLKLKPPRNLMKVYRTTGLVQHYFHADPFQRSPGMTVTNPSKSCLLGGSNTYHPHENPEREEKQLHMTDKYEETRRIVTEERRKVRDIYRRDFKRVHDNQLKVESQGDLGISVFASDLVQKQEEMKAAREYRVKQLWNS